MSTSDPRPGLERLHAALAARVDQRQLPGIVTLIAIDDQVHVDAIGAVALDSSRPMSRETIFRVASLTKPVLAAATMMLVEDGVLALDAPVETWLPELANRRVLTSPQGPLEDTVQALRHITLEDLLTFRFGSGTLFEPSFDPPVPIVQKANELQLVLSQPDPRTPHPPDEWMRRFGSLPLMYQPGERWQYNSGSLILGVLLARAADQSLPELFRTRILEPLGMKHTGFWLAPELTATLPSYYLTNPQTGQLERQDVSQPEEWSRPPVFPSGSAGLLSTVDDYLAFARMLLDDGRDQRGRQLLSPRSIQLMTTNQLTPAQMAHAGPLLGKDGWGYGVGIVVEPDESWPVPGRYGWSGGYGTVWFNDPHRRIVAMAMTQVSDFLWNGGATEFDQLVGQI
jgi:CubicO group peptidase (beta-lactamase class C family)